MNIKDFDIQVGNMRVFTNGDKNITVQELTEKPYSKNFSRDDVVAGEYKYVYNVMSFKLKDAEIVLQNGESIK